MLSIGNFSKITKVSTNALRYYDEIGLLKPAHVNHDNGYRYYDTSQLETMLLISKLKSCCLSLEEISEILAHPDDNVLLSSLLREKRQAAKKQLHHLTFTIGQMDHIISNSERGIHIMSYLDNIEVQLKEIQPQTILFIRRKMSTQDYGPCLAELYQTIEKEKLTVTGAPITVFHHDYEEEFNPDCYDNEVAIPVKETITGTRPLPGGLCVTATLHGPYTELPSVYTKLQQWIDKENYEASSDAYEVYVTNPHTTAPCENITEVYIPITRK